MRNSSSYRGVTTQITKLFGIASLLTAAATQPLSGLTIIGDGTDNPPNGCFNPKCDDKCDDKEGGTSSGNSIVNNYRKSFRHDALDFAFSEEGFGCAPCGSAIKSSDGLPSLELRRAHKYRSIHYTGWFGPGVFSNYEDFLVIYRKDEATGSGTIRMVDHFRFGDFTLSDTNDKDGIYQDTSFRTVNNITLYDAGDQVVVEVRDAVKAILTNHDGTEKHYEIFNLYGSATPNTLHARLTGLVDRNGNSIDIDYIYAANADDTTLGFERHRLWMVSQVVDAYGRTMSLTYDTTATVGAKYVVESIDVPVGNGAETISYQYNLNGLGIPEEGSYPIIGLSGVSYPDGTQSSFSLSLDAADQQQVLHIDDAGATTTHRRKQAHFTLSDYVDPVTGDLIPVSGRLLREIYNGENERQYANWSFPFVQTDGKLDTAHYVYNHGKMFRYIERGGYPVATHTAITFDLNQPVEGWEWEYTKSYGTDTQRRITRTVDALGRKTTYGLNPVSGDKTKVTYPDETEMHSQFNAFSQITYSRDSLGRVKTFTYDAFGNKLTETVGQVDSDEDGIPETVVGLTATRSWTYTSQGQIETATDFNGNVTEYFYSSGGSPSSIDGLGYLVKVVEPADIVGGPRAETLMSYDGSGRQISTTDPEGRTTSQTYDLRNRLLATTYNDGSTESYIYGYGMDQNLLVGKTDRNGNLTTFDFDDHGRLIETVIAANNPTIASLEACTWLPGTTLKETCTIDGDVTHYSYDWHLRPVGETKFPSNGSALSNLRKYDNARRLVVKTDLYGRSSFDVYDALDYRIRTVQELVPGSITSLLGLSSGDVPSQTELTTIVRDLNANAAYIVIDIVYNADRQVIAQVDGRGLVDLYEYDGRARRIVSLKNGAQIAAGATLDDIQNQVWTAITDPTVAQRTEIIYDEQSNISAMKHPRYFDSNDSQGYLKDQVTRTYTGRNLLASQTEAPGTLDAATEYFSYFLDKRAKGRTDGRGNVWSQLWHICCGRIQASLDPAGHGTITNTDFFGNVTHTAVVANLPNDVTAYDWHDPIDADTISEVTTKYDARNRQIAQTQWLTPLGFVNDHARPDLNGEDLPIADRLVAPLDPANFGDLRPATDGLTTTWAYDDNLTDGQDIDADPAYAAAIALANLGGNSAGSAALITNPAGETTLLVKDGLGRTVITVDPEEDIQQTVFDVLTPGLPGSAGELLTTTRIIDPAGLALTSSQHVDGGGRLLVTTDAEGFQTIMSYDANSNRISIRDANGVGDDCVFDIADREITCTDTQGDTTTRIFDAKDHIVVNTDAFGQSEIYVFDARGRKTVCTDRIGAVTEYAYDANNNVITITDAEGGLTRYLYDVRNLLVREEFPTHQAGTNPGDVGNDARWYAYDAGQRLTRRVDQQGDITRYRYDLANRLRARRYPDGAHDRFGYDAASRLIRARSNRYDVTVRRDYFSDSMLRREVMVIDGDQHVIKHRYDKANRLRRTTYPTGAVVARRWTDRSLNRAIRYEGDLIARFAHDAGRRETSRRYGNGIVTARTYRNDNLLESISAPGVAGFHYGYDANKRKTSVTDTELTAWSQTFAYDAEDRLVDWTRTGGDSSGQLAAQTWDLSLVGDWNNTARDGVVETRTHNAVHEITSTQVGANPTQAVIHDDKGNLIANPNRHATYQWDFDNRLSQAENTVDDLTHTYRYDALGRRVQKTATNADASTTTTTYVLAGSQVLTELQDGLASVSYVYGAYVDEPLAQIDHVTGEKHFYHADHRYSVAALTDESGQVCHRYAYDAYGNRSDFDAAGQPVIVSDADDKFHAYGHTGRRHDSETGLQYFRARYFDGKLGRFAGRDPLKYIDGMSMYLAYFVPAKMDPTGESTVHQWHLRCNKIPNKRERCKCHCVYSPPDYGKGSCCVTNCMKTPGRIGGLSKSTLLFAFPFFLFLVFYLRGRSNVQVLREA